MTARHEQQGHGPHRRSVLRAGAWAIPVIAVAAGAPAASASTAAEYVILDSDVRIDTLNLQADVSITITDGEGNAIAASTDFVLTIDGHSGPINLVTGADVGKDFSGSFDLDPTAAYTDYTTTLSIGTWTSRPLDVTVT